ncbi:hypothetical protein RUM43_004677 [Polyplax serrata]|uniref:Phosphatidic acid phosphatase type 2/haloperoxidase domain-containing protein n=1 Tax=Polyplax serrata TaxID=468196 RepID=A0AAN8SCE5_POLSC
MCKSTAFLSVWALITFLEFHIFTFWTIGFQCKDPNLSHRFRGDTIPFQYLLAITLAVPLIIILFVESVMMNSNESYLTTKKEKNLKQAWAWYGQYVFGFLILLLVVQVGKNLVGAPRPHFFDTCKPDKAVNCTSGHYVEYKCTNKNLTAWDLTDSVRSFPSGHAALGVYTAVFMSSFLQFRIPRNRYLVVPWLQCLLITWAVLCCLTRITDRRHHWWDVLAGTICGIVAAVFTVKSFCRNFQYKPRNPDKNLNDTVNINHAWNKKLLSSINNCNQKPSDDRELREVK